MSGFLPLLCFLSLCGRARLTDSRQLRPTVTAPRPDPVREAVTGLNQLVYNWKYALNKNIKWYTWADQSTLQGCRISLGLILLCSLCLLVLKMLLLHRFPVKLYGIAFCLWCPLAVKNKNCRASGNSIQAHSLKKKHLLTAFNNNKAELYLIRSAIY